MESLIQGFETPELIIMLGLGLAVLLFGYRIKKIAFFIVWFLLGYIGTTFLMPEIVKLSPEVGASILYQNLIPIAGGLLLALLGFSIEKLCVAGICFILTMLISVQYFGTEIQTLSIAAIIGVVVAGAAVMLIKPATVIATAAAGSYAVTLVLLTLISDIDQGVYYWPMILGFTVIGALFQFMTTKRLS